MTLTPAKLNLIGTAIVNSRVMTGGDHKHIDGVLPIYIQTLQLTLTVFSQLKPQTNEI